MHITGIVITNDNDIMWEDEGKGTDEYILEYLSDCGSGVNCYWTLFRVVLF